MHNWRKLADMEAQVPAAGAMEPEQSPRKDWGYMFEGGGRLNRPSGNPLFKPGQQVHVTPDEDDAEDFTEPFVGTVAREGSYNVNFNTYSYPVKAPDGHEWYCFEHQLAPA